MMPRPERPERVSAMLRQMREKAGISIEKAAADSGIPVQYVRLLEGETRVRVGVADELYLIPYFRRYATFLGLEGTSLVAEFLSQLKPLSSASPVTAVTFSYPSRIAWLWKPAAIVAVIVIAASLIAQQSPERPAFDDEDTPAASSSAVEPADGSLRSAAPPAAPATDHHEEHAAVAAAPVAVASPSPAAAAAGAVPAQAVAVAASGSARELRITAAEETWLAIGVDDESEKSLILKPGDSRTWTARDGFTLTIGNAGGITVSLDGRELPKLGNSGQVRRNLRLPSDAPPPSG